MSLDFHCFKALNDNLEAQLFLHVHFHASSDLRMVCGTMQLRFFKLGTVLTYAFKSLPEFFSSSKVIVLSNSIQRDLDPEQYYTALL